jgi:hypothetical protein
MRGHTGRVPGRDSRRIGDLEVESVRDARADYGRADSKRADSKRANPDPWRERRIHAGDRTVGNIGPQSNSLWTDTR